MWLTCTIRSSLSWAFLMLCSCSFMVSTVFGMSISYTFLMVSPEFLSYIVIFSFYLPNPLIRPSCIPLYCFYLPLMALRLLELFFMLLFRLNSWLHRFCFQKFLTFYARAFFLSMQFHLYCWLYWLLHLLV